VHAVGKGSERGSVTGPDPKPLGIACHAIFCSSQ
jgi:hypothetical protein